MPDLHLSQLTKRYGEVLAVDDVDLTIPEGSFFALLGPSGCGKTTTLRMVAGLDAPTSGQVRLGDENITPLKPYRRPVNTVFQNYALFPHLDVFENVAFGLRRQGRKHIRQEVDEMLSLVELSGMGGRKPGQLSGGQQQRVALARALINRPQVLLLDEPLGALDEGRRAEILPYLVRLRDEARIPMVYVSHDAAEMRQLATQVVLMQRGRVSSFGGVKVLS